MFGQYVSYLVMQHVQGFPSAHVLPFSFPLHFCFTRFISLNSPLFYNFVRLSGSGSPITFISFIFYLPSFSMVEYSWSVWSLFLIMLSLGSFTYLMGAHIHTSLLRLFLPLLHFQWFHRHSGIHLLTPSYCLHFGSHNLFMLLRYLVSTKKWIPLGHSWLILLSDQIYHLWVVLSV